jgi:hypothetical protein
MESHLVVENESTNEYALIIGETNELVNLVEAGKTKIPESAQFALQDKDWKKAMESEIAVLKKNKTWELVKPPPGRKLVDCKWVFRSKEDENGKEVKKKARLVAKGFTQQYGIDYEETYSPVMKMVTLRLLIAIAALKKLHIKYADFESAYLQSEMNEEIFMKQPEGFEELDKDGNQLVCLLKKSLYGLKQSGRNWNLRINKWLLEHQFTRSKYDTCLYTSTKNGRFIAVLLYVDDIVGFVEDPKDWNELINEMKKELRVTNLGDANWLLGMKISHEKEDITIDQSKYIRALLERHQMEDCKPASTPMDSITEVQFREEEENREKNKLPISEKQEYMRIVGGLIYASIITRPDISYAVSKLGENLANPIKEDIIRAKRVLRYLKGTQHYKIRYTENGNANLIGYSDSDWAGDHKNRRSTSGYAFLLAGGAISWSSKHQSTVALSSAEAEYMALAQTTQEAIYLRGILEDIGFYPKEPTKIYSDNQSSIKIASNQITRNRTKHIAAKYHFTREQIENSKIILEYIPTEFMAADSLTKSVKRNILGRTNLVLFGMNNNIPN